jgi:hypothetical protein
LKKNTKMSKSNNNYQKLIQNKNLLESLSKCKKKLREAIVENADRDLIECICMCAFNILEGNINLTEQEKSNLKKYKHAIRKLTMRSNLKKKKKILLQSGGFLQFLIPAAITGLSSIISSLISKSD